MVANKIFTRLLTAFHFFLNFHNPLHIVFKRYFCKRGMMTAVDRRTGVSCKCTVASYQMFEETWYRKDYDIPRFPIRKGDVVIDIGANQGFFTCYAAHQGAKLYAFEPFSDSFKTLMENVEMNKFSSHVVAKPWAVGGQNGFAELIYTNGLGGGLNTTEPKFAAHFEARGTQILGEIQVPCFTLPKLMEDFDLTNVRLCKLDCEGAELDILKQLRKSDLCKIDAFVLEYHLPVYPLDELMQLILGWGTHQVSFAEEENNFCLRNILRLVSNRCLRSQ